MSTNKEFIFNSNNIEEIKERLILELYKIRKKKKITQNDISKSVKLPQPTISRIESLEHDVTLNTLIKYAEAIGIELSIRIKDIDKKITNNENKNYLVALLVDEDSENSLPVFCDIQQINAKNINEAEIIYNKQNNCNNLALEGMFEQVF